MRKEQSKITEIKQTPGYRVEKEEETDILKCYGRIQGYNPTYLEMGLFADKLISYTHQEIMNFGVADTMAAIRESWWIPRLRAAVKREKRKCAICKVFSTNLTKDNQLHLYRHFVPMSAGHLKQVESILLDLFYTGLTRTR